MYIPLDPPHKLVSIREAISLTEDCLEERLHSYSWQHPVAKEIAEKLWPYVPTMSYDVQSYFFDVDFKNSPVKKVEVRAQKLIAFQESAGFAGFNPDEKKVIINIVVPKGHFKDEKQFIGAFTQALSHELNHAGTALDKYSNNVTTDVPDMYGVITQATKAAADNGDNDIYYFCYSLYCTSNLEITAFVSQTASQIYAAAGKNKSLSYEEIKQYLPKTNSYRAFLLAKNIAQKWMETTKDNKDFFSRRLKEDYGIVIDNFDKTIEDLYNRAQYGLEKCCANAMNCVE